MTPRDAAHAAADREGPWIGAPALRDLYVRAFLAGRQDLVEALRALIDAWVSEANRRARSSDGYYDGSGAGVAKCADELGKLLNASQ